MPELHHNERLVINQLLDQGVFTSTPTRGMTKTKVEAIEAVRRPPVQQRINAYLKDLVGIGPQNYQENFVFLLGRPQLDAETVHVLLATLKAVINLPESQQRETLVVPALTIVRQVHSEVVNLEEREIYRRITSLFVDRFGLFVPDVPINKTSDLPQEVTEYWDINPDFNYVAQCIVDDLEKRAEHPSLTAVQRVNRALLTRQFIYDRAQDRPGARDELWEALQQNKEKIADQWSKLQRFDLEVGQHYALLLDNQRQPVTARAFVVAIAVAQQLGAGVPVEQLTAEIKRVMPSVIGDQEVVPTEVKKTLLTNELIEEHNGYYVPTRLVQRFAVATANEEDVVHANQ